MELTDSIDFGSSALVKFEPGSSALLSFKDLDYLHWHVFMIAFHVLQQLLIALRTTLQSLWLFQLSPDQT